jgi:hypothetical protein
MYHTWRELTRAEETKTANVDEKASYDRPKRAEVATIS